MANKFKKFLIRFTRLLPFILVSIFLINYIEIIYAITHAQVYEDIDGELAYATPISDFIGNLIYIDNLDIMLLYVLAIALEFCKYNLRAIHFLTLGIVVRIIVENFYIQEFTLITICTLMSLIAIYCLYNGLRMI